MVTLFIEKCLARQNSITIDIFFLRHINAQNITLFLFDFILSKSKVKMSVLLRTFHFAVRNKSASLLSVCNFSKITITDDGSTFVALHPEQKFPYELSKPMPIEEVRTKNSPLKMDDREEVMRVFKDISPDTARENLMKMTLTTKHHWFPRSRDKKKKLTPMDRTYL